MSKSSHFLSSELYAYYEQLGFRESDVLKQLRQQTATLARAQMQVLPEQGQLLQLLVQCLQAEEVLEVGTFTGYSSICMAMALPAQGQLTACDSSEEWTSMAKTFWQLAGVDDKISLVLGPAVDTLNQFIAEQRQFDFAFVDANKDDYDRYYEQCLVLLKPGGTMMFDNMLSAGSFLASDQSNQSNTARSIRQLNTKIHQDERVDMCLLPIGSGMTMVRKR